MHEDVAETDRDADFQIHEDVAEAVAEADAYVTSSSLPRFLNALTRCCV